MHPVNIVSTSTLVAKIVFPDSSISFNSSLTIGIVGSNAGDSYLSDLVGSPSTYCTFLDYGDHIQQLLETCDLIFCVTVDFDNRHYDFVKKYDHNKIHWCLPGSVNFATRNPVILYTEWWHITNRNYQSGKIVLDLACFHKEKFKNKWFISLLGRQAPHKADLYSQLCLTKDKIPGYIFYQGAELSDDFFEIPSAQKIRTTEHYSQNIIEYKNVISLSGNFITPEYKDAAIDVFAESKFDYRYIFTTERIAKCFLAKQPWLGLMPEPYIAFYKNLGFRLDPQIDYSYTKAQDSKTQANLLVKELDRLHQSSFVPDQSVLDHNFDLFYNTDWRQEMCNRVVKVIEAYDS